VNLPARFTIDGSDGLEAHLARACELVLEKVRSIIPPKRLDALLLGGGYGRGEGGVRRGAQGDLPYNDLEFYVMIRGNTMLAEQRFRGSLAELNHQLSPSIGVEIDFKILSFAKLRRSQPSMFYYDLAAGHRWVLGNEPQLRGCERHRDPTEIPLEEATRLLMNRCAGLLFSAERLRRQDFGHEEADFVGRNLAKAQLALGDVVLTAYGQYHWSCRWRAQRLQALAQTLPYPWIPAVVEHHQAGVEFKLHPVYTDAPREMLVRHHADLVALALPVWLWLENQRLDASFTSAASYASTSANLCPKGAVWKNVLLNLRTFGSRAARGDRVTRDPRERLLRSLAVLLWMPEDKTSIPLVQNWLNTHAADFAQPVQAYERLWRRFN
jgi:hypothetical protein